MTRIRQPCGKIAGKVKLNMPLNRIPLLFLSVSLLGLTACGSGSPPSGEIAATRELGPVKFPDIIRGRDGGYSALFGGQSIWIFGDTSLNSPAADGATWRSSTSCRTVGPDARNNLDCQDEPLDAQGAPEEFLPFTSSELSYNQAHFRTDIPEADQARWALWPGPVVVDPNSGRALVFYSKVFARPGIWNFEMVGYSFATWASPDTAPVRPEVNPGASEPTLLFPDGATQIGSGALIHNGYVYVYGCRSEWLSWPNFLGRVRFSEALHREAWEFYQGSDSWNDNPETAAAVLEAATMITVHWNDYLKKFLAIYSTPLVNTLSLRTADRPEGPWSDAREFHQGVAPLDSEQWDYFGLAHPEFARENGRVEYVSYFRPTEFLKGEIRLVEVTFK
ncbi:MAG: DUF4185 domain-containing protein [Proteobacteria bacterium]|nr:DUF4185 domain-containing protein [Pseudomonadota bacterium]